MTSKTRSTALAAALSSVLLGTTAVQADDKLVSQRAPEDQASEAVPSDIRGRPIARIALGEGKDATRVEFYALPDGVGGETVGVLEASRGDLGLDDLPRLAGQTNPRELFHALAKDGQDEPALLAQNFDAPSLGNKGWARDALAMLPKPDAAARASAGCSWTSFKNGFNALRPDINGTKYWYSAVNGDHDTAGGDYYVYPYPSTTWKVFASNARTLPWNNQYHNYTFYNIDKFKTRVRVCEFHSGNQYQDRYIQFRYRSENNVVRAAAYTRQLSMADLGWHFTWVWAPTNGQKDYDWVTLVGGATVLPHSHPDDRYYVAVQKK